jgi:hypothetical protein
MALFVTARKAKLPTIKSQPLLLLPAKAGQVLTNKLTEAYFTCW